MEKIEKSNNKYLKTFKLLEIFRLEKVSYNGQLGLIDAEVGKFKLKFLDQNIGENVKELLGLNSQHELDLSADKLLNPIFRNGLQFSVKFETFTSKFEITTEVEKIVLLKNYFKHIQISRQRKITRTKHNEMILKSLIDYKDEEQMKNLSDEEIKKFKEKQLKELSEKREKYRKIHPSNSSEHQALEQINEE
jgi:hypothetical protein